MVLHCGTRNLSKTEQANRFPLWFDSRHSAQKSPTVLTDKHCEKLKSPLKRELHPNLSMSEYCGWVHLQLCVIKRIVQGDVSATQLWLGPLHSDTQHSGPHNQLRLSMVSGVPTVLSVCGSIPSPRSTVPVQNESTFSSESLNIQLPVLS